MAEKRQVLDVWIVETNTVYRQVPFTVVGDWVQQGRLLEEDQLRPSGTTEWRRLGDLPAFAAYLPKTEPYRVEDQAEALEPVQVDFAWKARSSDEDDDVDMIPLIDVSLVLLIFFMMTASVATLASPIQTPIAVYGGNLSSGTLWIGIDRDAKGEPVYSLGEGDQGPKEEDRGLSQQAVLQHLHRLLEAQAAEVRIRADHRLPYEVVKKLTLLIEQHPKVRRIHAEVSERTQK